MVNATEEYSQVRTYYFPPEGGAANKVTYDFYDISHSTGRAANCTVNGELYAYAGTVTNCTVNGRLYVSGGLTSHGYYDLVYTYFTPTVSGCTVNGTLRTACGGDVRDTVITAGNAVIGSGEEDRKYFDIYGWAKVGNLTVQDGSVGVYYGGELSGATINGFLYAYEGAKLSGVITCKGVGISNVTSSATITVKLDLRDYAKANYTESKMGEDGNGTVTYYYANYTTRTIFYKNHEVVSVVDGTFDNKDGRFDMRNWKYTFSADIGYVDQKTASSIIVDFGDTEKDFDGGTIRFSAPMPDSDEPLLLEKTSVPFSLNSNLKKWQYDNNIFVYNAALCGETADVLWLERGWDEYNVMLPADAMGGVTYEDVSITDQDTGNGVFANVDLNGNELVIRGGMESGNLTIFAEDTEKREHKCDLELLVVPESIPVIGKIGAGKYADMLRKAQKGHVSKISDILPNDIKTSLLGMNFTLANIGMSLTINWTKPSMELKLQGKMEWEIGKGKKKKLTIDLSGDNYISITHEDNSFGWDLVGELKIPDFTIGKFGFSDMEFKVNKGASSFTVGGYIKLPMINYKFGGNIGIKEGYLDSMTIGVDDLNVPLGTTGLMLQGIAGSVEGIATDLDMTFGGGLKLTYGPEINVTWDCDWLGIDDGKYSLLELNAQVKISTAGEFTGKASLTSLGGFITGSGEVKGNDGNFSIDGTFGLLNNCISVSGKFNSGSGGVTISGKGTVSVPRDVCFGPLAGNGLTMQVLADFGSRYVMAWEDVEVFGNKYSFGFRCTFDGDVDLLGNSDLLGGDDFNKKAPRLLRSASPASFTILSSGNAAQPSASKKYTVSDSGMTLFQVNFSVSAASASVSLSYNGVEFTQEAIASGLYADMQIVGELTDPSRVTIAVNNTKQGEWTVNAYGDKQATFGAYTLSEALLEPVLDAVELGSDQRSATIRYTLGDLSSLENATVSVFRADGDATEQGGTLVGKFSAADATGTFTYSPDDSLPGGSYAFYIMVSGDNLAPAYSKMSAACDFATIDTEAPDQIQKVHAQWSSAGSTLTWDVPYDDIGVAGYKVGYRTAEEDEWHEADVAEASCTFSQMPNGTWLFRVAAYDAAGNLAAWSDEGSVLVNLVSNALYKDVTFTENVELAEYNVAYKVNAAAVKLTAAGNSLVSDSTVGNAEINGTIEKSVIAGNVALLDGAFGNDLTVNGTLTAGAKSVGTAFGAAPADEIIANFVTLNNVTVNDGGKLELGKGALATGVTVSSGGAVVLSDDAKVSGLTLDYGAMLTVAGSDKYRLADDIRTAGTLNTHCLIEGNGHKIIFEQYKQTSEYYEYYMGVKDSVALLADTSKISSNALEIIIDSNVYGDFKIAGKAENFNGTITVSDCTDGSSAKVGIEKYTAVGNALCTLTELYDGFYLKTIRSEISAPVISSVDYAEDNAYDYMYVNALLPEDTGGSVPQVIFRYSLNEDMSNAVTATVTSKNYYNDEWSLYLKKDDFSDNATCYVQTAVENEYGVRSPWSDKVSFTVVPKLLPAAPTTLTVSGATNPGSNYITFTASGVDNSGYSVRNYRFRYADNPEMENAVTVTSAGNFNQVSIAKEDIVDGRDYYVQAGVMKGADWSYWSETVTFNTQGWDYENITVDADGPYAGLSLNGRKARNVTVTSGGYFYGGNTTSGWVDGVTIDGGFFRDDGIRIDNVTVNDGDYWVDSTVTNLVVNGGRVRVMDGTINGGTIGVNGFVELSSSYHPKLSGTILIQGKMNIYYRLSVVADAASFVFDLGAHETDKEKMFIDYVSPIQGSRTFTAKVDDTPEVGDYRLCYPPDSNEMYVRLAADDGSEIGVLSLDGAAISHKGLYYTLVNQNSAVYLHVSDNDAPAFVGKVKLSKDGTVYDARDGYSEITVAGNAECDYALVEKGGSLSYITVGQGGSVDMYGELYGATIQNGGELTLWEDGLLIIEDVIVERGGTFTIEGGKVQYDTEIHIAGGNVVLNGPLQGYEKVSSEWEPIAHWFHFDINQLSAPNTDVMISDYELLKPCYPNFAVTVSRTQAKGEYKLLGNASNFSGTVTINFEEDYRFSEYLYPSLAREIDGTSYLISVKDDVLTLTVGDGSDNPSDPFADADDWTDMKTSGADGAVGFFDMNEEIQGEIGGGDLVDYLAFTLESAANVSFNVFSENAVKFTINTLTGTEGKYSLKANQSTSVGAGKSVTTKQLLLEKGTYYIGIAATDKKADSASYMIEVDNSTVFFTNGNNDDDWADVKTSGASGLSASVGSVTKESGELLTDWVGYGDAVDYTAFTLDSAANLVFDLNVSDAAKFTIYSLQGKTDKKGVTTYSLKSLQSTSLKAGDASIKSLLLEKGTYYMAMESTNAKKGGSVEYSVSVSDKSAFFTKGDNSDDWADVKTSGASGLSASVGSVTKESGELLTDWVGYGDAVDYTAFTLDSAANLVFDLNVSDAAKFTIYSLQGKTDKKGVTTYSLKSLQSTSLKAGDASTKSLLLEKGTYYMAMESTNAKKGGSVEYSVSVDDKSVFFTDGDNTDDWTDMKTSGASGLSASVGSVTKESGELLTDWVGYGDAVDYTAFTLDSAANLVFDLNVSDAAKFTIYSLQGKTDKKGVTTYSLKSLQSTSLKAGDASTKSLLLEKGTYYMAMESTNAKKGGSVDYSVSVNKTSKFFPAATDNNTWNDATQISGDTLTGWVGFGDKADFWEIQMPEAGKLTLDFDETTLDAAKHNEIKITCLDDKGKSVSLVWSGDMMQSKKEIASSVCYIGITCANEKKFDTFYNIAIVK